jgi:hypothetical protein
MEGRDDGSNTPSKDPMRSSSCRSHGLLGAALTSLFVACLAPALAFASVCSPLPNSVKYYGHLDDGRKFGVTLIDNKTTFNAFEGRLYIGPLYRDIAVEGNVVETTDLTLRDVEGHVVLEGHFLDDFEGLHDLGCDALHVRLADGSEGTMRMIAGGFALATLQNQDAVNAVILDVHDAILAGDARRLAKHVRFPLKITYPSSHSSRPIVIRNARDFIHEGHEIIGPNLQKLVGHDVPHDPFCRGDDCALANGWIWFDKDLKITSLIPG